MRKFFGRKMNFFFKKVRITIFVLLLCDEFRGKALHFLENDSKKYFT